VPPHVAEILRSVGRAGMDVADHALAGRDRAREAVLDGMAFFIFANSRVGGEAVAEVAARGVGTRVSRVAVVRVKDVAGGAAGGAIISGLIVRAKEIEQRVEQARALEPLKDRVGATEGAEAAVAEAVVAALESSEGVAGLRG